MRTRLHIFATIFLIAILGLVVRLFFWQVVKGADLAKLGTSQYQRQQDVSSKRGDILAGDNSVLVTDVNDWTLFATKSALTDNPRIIANELAQYLVDDPNDHAKLLNKAEDLEGILNQNGMWLPLEHRVDNAIKKEIENLKINGIGFDPEPVRFYPEGSSSAHLLGFVGKDDNGNDKGYFGLEGYYDLTLEGKNGLVTKDSDVFGNPILVGNANVINASQGVDLVTNIDKTIQVTIEKELADGLKTYSAKSGLVIMMNPNNGAILGTASIPTYDPNTYWRFTNEDFKDPIIANTFEPGSIFKPIIMAGALDAGLVTPDSKCTICDNVVSIDNYTIDTWNGEHHPNSSMTDVIVNSDNIGMVFVGQKLGQDKTYDYLSKFGFGTQTGIDLQGEVALPLRTKGTWSNIDLATTTFGQGIAVTPIQILRAIGIIANGGKMIKPQVVKQIKTGDWSTDVSSQIGQQVISTKAAKEVKDMMVQTVLRGESKWAAPAGFLIAGKTGTAQIPVAGHYDPTKTIASFVGFAPADNPKFVMLVTLASPQSSEWGAETAAPLWFKIAEDLFPYFGIQPNQ